LLVLRVKKESLFLQNKKLKCPNNDIKRVILNICNPPQPPKIKHFNALIRNF